MVYCAAFDCNANRSENKVTGSWFKFPTESNLFKKKASSRRSTADLARSRKLVSTAIRTRECTALGYPGAKIR